MGLFCLIILLKKYINKKKTDQKKANKHENNWNSFIQLFYFLSLSSISCSLNSFIKEIKQSVFLFFSLFAATMKINESEIMKCYTLTKSSLFFDLSICYYLNYYFVDKSHRLQQIPVVSSHTLHTHTNPVGFVKRGRKKERFTKTKNATRSRSMYTNCIELIQTVWMSGKKTLPQICLTV